MKSLTLKRNYWTNAVRVVDVVVVQLARVARAVHEEHVRVAAAVEVIRTQNKTQTKQNHQLINIILFNYTIKNNIFIVTFLKVLITIKILFNFFSQWQ